MSRIVKLFNFSIPHPFTIVLILVTIQLSGKVFAQDTTTKNPNAYLIKGEQLESQSPDSAIYYYQLGLNQLNDTSTGTKYIRLRIDLLTRIGKIFHNQSKYEFAADYYNKVLKESENLTNDSLIAEAYFNIAEINLENGSYVKAINAYDKSIKLFRRNKNIEGVFWGNIGLGIIYRKVGNASLSKKYYELANKIGEEEKREDLIAISYNNIGNLYRQIGEYDKAFELLQLALSSFEKYGERRFISDCLDGIGELYAEISNYERAIHYFNRSKNIAEFLGDNYRLLSRYANIAKSYSAIGDNEKALMFFSKTIELAQSIGDKSRLSEVYIKLSDFYLFNNDFKNALLNLDKSLIISRDVGDTVSIASALNSLSEINIQKGDYNNAYKNALKSYRISSQKNMMNILVKSSFNLSRILELLGNYKDALYYYRIHKKTKDLILNTEKLKILEETEAKYNIEKLEREKLELENASLLNEEKVQRRNNLIMGLIIGILLITVFGGLYLHKRNIEKSAKEHQANELKNRIELLNTELNEKNRELTSKALMISQNNEMLKEAIESVQNYLATEGNNKRELNKVKLKLQEIYEEKNWDDFMHHFEQVHPKFYKKLIDRCGDLSSMEQKVCAFIKMNLNTKDISKITGQSVKGIEVMRSRIRKKLQLHHEESLSKAIQNI